MKKETNSQSRQKNEVQTQENPPEIQEISPETQAGSEIQEATPVAGSPETRTGFAAEPLQAEEGGQAAAQAKACAAKLIHKMAAAAKIAASFRQIAPIYTPLRQQYARRRPPLCRRAGKAQKKPASGRANFSTAAEGRGRRSFWVREESPPAGERFNFPFFCGGRGGRSCRRRYGSCAPLCRRAPFRYGCR